MRWHHDLTPPPAPSQAQPEAVPALPESELPLTFFELKPPLGPYEQEFAAGKYEQWCVDEVRFLEVRNEGQRRIDALEAALQAANERAERMQDLVRYQRGELFEAGLITHEEFAALVADSEGGKRVARLEGYDATRKQLSDALSEAQRLREQLAQSDTQLAEMAIRLAEQKNRADKITLRYALCGGDLPEGFMPEAEPIARLQAYVGHLEARLAALPVAEQAVKAQDAAGKGDSSDDMA